MSNISTDQIKFNPTSYIDPNGRVFEWQGEIYRAITQERSKFFNELINHDCFKQLQEKGWVVKTEKTEHSLDGYGFILKHERISPITYCFEWPPQMLKEAAILTLKICLDLMEHGFIIQDAYPWNIHFKNTKPVFIDIGSIVPIDKTLIWEAYQEFCNFFLYPLYLYSINLYSTTRPLLFDYLNGVSDQSCYQLLPFSYKFLRPGVFSRLTSPLIAGSLMKKMKLDNKIRNIAEGVGSKIDLTNARIKFFKSLLKDVEAIRFPSKKSEWSSYYSEMLPYSPSPKWSAKHKTVFEILNKLKPKSVLDIACNEGWYSILAAKQGASVVSFDTDANCISRLYKYAKEEKNLNITPLVMNFMNLSPEFGWSLKQFPPATSRLKADMCFAFAIVHHLVFSQWQNFDRVIDSIDLFAKEWVLVEYIPKEDEKVKILLSRKKDIFPWYTLENFIKALSKRYKVRDTFDSYPTGRKLILCEK